MLQYIAERYGGGGKALGVRVGVLRSRPLYALLVALVIGTGLLWRSGLIPLSNFFSKYGGDALWALMVFLGFGFVFRRSSTVRIGLAALCFAWSVEFLQLYHAHWIDAIRSTRFGRLVLGDTFNVPDLIAYAVGVALGVVAEWVFSARAGESRKKPNAPNQQ